MCTWGCSHSLVLWEVDYVSQEPALFSTRRNVDTCSRWGKGVAGGGQANSKGPQMPKPGMFQELAMLLGRDILLRPWAAWSPRKGLPHALVIREGSAFD